MNQYTLQLPERLERQLRRFRASLRQSIRARLQEIVESLAAPALTGPSSKVLKGPPLRFYVFEGYRVSYQVDPATRSVLVLELRPANG
jgi:mRNA-degrading endonuclease RelE of RelBE toxin-antitoxin system